MHCEEVLDALKNVWDKTGRPSPITPVARILHRHQRTVREAVNECIEKGLVERYTERHPGAPRKKYLYTPTGKPVDTAKYARV